jgi:aminoglycoside 6'-N-acetyltransferase I
MRIEICNLGTLEEWLALRPLLWPYDLGEHRAEAQRALANPDAITFLARDDQDHAIGFAEATLRHDYVNGCSSSPVGFLEGLYVREEARRMGVARALCRAVEAWVLDRGASELASDAWLDSIASQRTHEALGFSETERVVYFRKRLD